MHRFLKANVSILLIFLLLFMGRDAAVSAQTLVEPLPEDNLVENPWFRDGDKPSLAGWTDAAGTNVIWSLSQKQSNPSPDQVMGTSARLAFGSGQGGGTGQGGVDAMLYQVVSADPSLTHLKFKIHWVTQWIEQATVTIYGGESANGPWTAVWTPLDINQTTSTGGAWTQTELLDTTVSKGFSFYKVELFGRYPEGRQQGAKYTGVYFSVDGQAGDVSEATPLTPTPAQVLEPTSSPIRPTTAPATNTPPPTQSVDAAMEIAEANTPRPEPTQPAVRPAQAARETAVPAVTPTQASNAISPVSLVIIGVLLLLAIVLGIGWVRAVRSK